MKSIRKIFPFVIIALVAITVLSSCSSSRKMKKKCLDCPEFSYEKPAAPVAHPVNENI